MQKTYLVDFRWAEAWTFAITWSGLCLRTVNRLIFQLGLLQYNIVAINDSGLAALAD